MFLFAEVFPPFVCCSPALPICVRPGGSGRRRPRPRRRIGGSTHKSGDSGSSCACYLVLCSTWFLSLFLSLPLFSPFVSLTLPRRLQLPTPASLRASQRRRPRRRRRRATDQSPTAMKSRKGMKIRRSRRVKRTKKRRRRRSQRRMPDRRRRRKALRKAFRRSRLASWRDFVLMIDFLFVFT